MLLRLLAVAVFHLWIICVLLVYVLVHVRICWLLNVDYWYDNMLITNCCLTFQHPGIWYPPAKQSLWTLKQQQANKWVVSLVPFPTTILLHYCEMLLKAGMLLKATVGSEVAAKGCYCQWRHRCLDKCLRHRCCSNLLWRTGVKTSA